MSLMNYHELTMGESRSSPSRNLQFRIICGIMTGCTVYSVMTSGVLQNVKVTEGEFPGGDLVYKFTGRDYAASNSLIDHVAKDISLKWKEYGGTAYTVYLDDPMVHNGRNQRFACGILLNDDTFTSAQENNQERKSVLMDKNADIVDPTPKEIEDLAAYELWARLKYSSQELPKAKAAVVEFKFTNGFVSALVHSYKVFPAIREYAKKHGAAGLVPIVVTSCDPAESMCTHYVPLENAEPFSLGQPEQEANAGDGLIKWSGVVDMLFAIKDQLLSFTPFGAKKTTESQSDEL